MKRRAWFEIHDDPRFPRFLRDLVTEALESVWNGSRAYAPIAPLLREALMCSGADRVIDLCSGGGGPWPGLYADVMARMGLPVCFTDKYPNPSAFAQAGLAMGSEITGCAESIDATRLPADQHGFRTMFSSFHHFGPSEARAILADALARREGIAVFELAQRNVRTLLATAVVPLLALRESLRMRPFRWKRIFWTWLVPIVPAVLLIDGILSCLRSYSQADLRELVFGITQLNSSQSGYNWHIGEERRGLVGILWLIGIPDSARSRAFAAAVAPLTPHFATQTPVTEAESGT